MALESGQVVDNRYRVGSILGKGGMGSVYRGWDTRLDRPVALKEMVSQPGLEPEMLAQMRKQFEHEARVLATLTHPHLVRVTDYFSWEDNQYLVMDFVEGQGLDARIREQGPQAESNVIRWATQLLGALAYCHGRGVIHRDIKPQNIIITPEGNAVLVDFGLVKLWDPADPKTRTAMRGAGTPAYAPPEQYDVDWGHTDPRSDIYSLGATLYHGVTGQVPPSATQRMANPANFAPPRRINAALSAAVEAAILKAMEVPMDRRFQRAEEMAQALGLSALQAPKPQKTEVLPEMKLQGPEPSPPSAPLTAPPSLDALPELPPTAPPPAAKRKVWLVIAAAVAFCLVAAVGSGFAVRIFQRIREARATDPPPITETLVVEDLPTDVSPTVEEEGFQAAKTVNLTPGDDLELALEIAEPGTLLVLAPGTYRLTGPVDVYVPLRLRGAGMDETFIVSPAESHLILFRGKWPFGAEDLTFRHEGDAPADVVVVDGGEILFTRCRFVGAVYAEGDAARAGLRLMGNTTGTVRDCEAVDNNLDGIQVADNVRVLLENNLCSENVQNGIRYQDGAGGTARKNLCESNGWNGIILRGKAEPSLEGNVVRNNGEAGLSYGDDAVGMARENEALQNALSGIIVKGNAQPTLEANLCEGNEQNGIGYFDTAGGEARGNSCSDNGLNGIGVNEQAQPLLEGNICENNAKIGIRYGDSAGGIARRNQCTENQLSGFLVTGEAQPILEENESTGNVETGIVYFENAGGTARGNRCLDNGLHGIGVNGNAEPKLEDNLCADNAQVGIRYSDNAAGTARGNTCRGNGLSGIVVRAEASPTLVGNSSSENVEDGIAYFGMGSGVARANSCEGNTLNGISTSDQAQPLLEENTCTGNDGAGIASFGESSPIIRDNTLTNNRWGLFIKETANPEVGDNAVYDNETDIDDRR